MAKTNGTKNYKRLATVSTLAILCAAAGHFAGAQTAPANGPAPSVGQGPAQTAPAPDKLEQIVVTARKRNEKLLSVPIAISAFTAKDLKARGIYTIQDLSNQTPGLTVDSTVNSSGRNDRSFPQYVIRGMVPSITTNPTTTVFLDGAPLISGQIDNLQNLERVEVLKGPQSAYFGRETFAGAISLITKNPSPTPQVTIDSLIASPNWYDQHITVEGPIVPGKLAVSGSFRYYSRQGSYNNQAVANKSNQKLGDQGTKSGNFKAVLTPNENLTISVLGLYWHDDDGPSAQELILPSQSNCLGFWFCGQVPDRLSTQPAANDSVTPAIKRLLAFLGTPAADQVFKPLNNRYGLVRDAYHGSMDVDYNINAIGATATSLTAIDLQKYSELQDLANDDATGEPNFAYTIGLPYADPYYEFPFFVEDEYRSFSQEVRLTSNADQRFRWLVGVNYEYTRVDASIGGGNGFDFFSGDSPDTSNTIGAFYGLGYDILPRLALSFEGRLQADKESTSPFGGYGEIAHTYRDFLPRVSLKYAFSPTLMAYITYSKGTNPGTFNGNILSLPAAEKNLLTTEYGAKVQVAPEELTNFELGSKGSFFDDTLSVSADIYYDIWYRQIDVNAINFLVTDPGTGVQHVENTAVYTNNGKTDLSGLEAETDWEPLPGLVFNVAGAINASNIRSGACVSCEERIGTTDVQGNQLPDVSKYQATVGAQYNGSFEFLDGTSLAQFHDWGYYGRGDYTYKSATYEDKDDLVYTPPLNLLNLRIGVTHGPLTIEAFVDNVTNYGGPTSLAAIVDLGSPAETYAHASDSLVGGLPYLRSFGVRLHYAFGL